MPLDPEELDGIGDEVAAHYSALELAVLAAVAETARRGLARPGWAAEQARLFPRLASQIRRLVSEGTSAGVSLAADAVSEAARRGRDSARADLAAIEETVARRRAVPPAVRPVDGGRTFGPTPARVTPTSPVQATSGPRDLTPVSVAQVPPSPASATVAAVRAEAARQATTEALETAGRAVTERTLNRWQQVVAEMARAELAGDATSLQVQQRVLDEWARRGLPAFTDKAGRTWSLQAYAEMNVRTATHQAFGDAHRAELAGAGMDLVIVSSHRNPADVCQPYERKVLSLSGRLSGSVQVPSATSDELVTVQVHSSLDMAKANGYDHPNAILGGSQSIDTLAGAVGASKSAYRGPAITIRTAKGHEVTVSPEHPVLTSRGWVIAKAVSVGDHVFRALGSDSPSVLSGDKDGYDVPPTVEQEFSSLKMVGRSVLRPTAGLHFDDDRQFIEGEIDVVVADHCLLPVPDTHVIQETGEVDFVWSNSGFAGVPGLGSLEFDLGAVGSAVAGSLPEGDATGHEASANRSSGDAEVGRDVLRTHAGVVHLDNALVVESFVDSQVDARLYEMVSDARWGDSQDPRTVELAVAGGMEPDEVVGVNQIEFAGHAYDFQTVEGVYAVNSIMLHNCKHVESLYVPGVSRPGGTRPNPAGYAATQEQRRLERGIREWKRREAVALSDEARAKAKAKVLEWQGRTREHIKVHGLDRRYYREQVRVGQAA